MPIRRKTQNVSCCDEDSALHSLSDWLGRRLLFMVKLYAANDCRNDTLGMAAGSLSGRRKLSAFLELERVTGISYAVFCLKKKNMGGAPTCCFDSSLIVT